MSRSELYHEYNNLAAKLKIDKLSWRTSGSAVDIMMKIDKLRSNVQKLTNEVFDPKMKTKDLIVAYKNALDSVSSDFRKLREMEAKLKIKNFYSPNQIQKIKTRIRILEGIENQMKKESERIKTIII